MKEIFIVYGIKECANAGIDFYLETQEFNTEVFGVFTTFAAALCRLKEVAAEAFDYFIENTAFSIDDDALENAKNADLFSDYYGESDPDIRWEFFENTDYASWQMYPVNPDPFDKPILAHIIIKKCEITE